MEGGQDSIVGRLLLQVVIPREGGAVAGEGRRPIRSHVSLGIQVAIAHHLHPRVLVSVIPDGNSLASILLVQAGVDDGLVVGGLLLEVGVGSRCLHTDIKLSDGDLNAKGGEVLDNTLNGILRSRVADSEVSLETNAINLNTVGLDHLHNLLCSLLLVARPLNVVIVVIELRIRVGSGGSSESDGDVGLADGIVKDHIAVGAIFVERLIDDIPVDAAALVVGDLVLDVVLQNLNQSCVVESAALDPVGQLVVPNEVVAAQLLAVGLSEVGNHITLGVGECVARSFNRIPLLVPSVVVQLSSAR